MATPALDTSYLRSRLKLKSIQSENLLTAHHAKAVALLKSAGVNPGALRKHAQRLLTSGVTTTALMLTPPVVTADQVALPGVPDSALVSSFDLHRNLSEHLRSILPAQVVPLTTTQEKEISDLIHEIYGVHAYAELEGNKLNRSYGLIGAEQHLPRYPGDTVEQHDAIQKSGITPGRGAWGYFARSKSDMTPELVQMEKYYVAVQTLYLPDWDTRLSYLRDWYKHRRVLVVNPKNGKAVIAVVADSGPAASTGKHFGGSPEVMDYLQMKDGKQRGPVILFFLDDPQKAIPLGPLEYNLEKGPALLTTGGPTVQL